MAINITQADDTRLDTVLITLGKLFQIFSDPLRPLREDVRNVVLTRLEARWGNLGSDREIFILALVLNPYVRTSCFQQSNRNLTEGALLDMFERVFKRVMQRDPDSELMIAFGDYIARVGRWSDNTMRLSMWREQAVREVCASLYSSMPQLLNSGHSGQRLTF